MKNNSEIRLRSVINTFLQVESYVSCHFLDPIMSEIEKPFSIKRIIESGIYEVKTFPEIMKSDKFSEKEKIVIAGYFNKKYTPGIGY